MSTPDALETKIRAAFPDRPAPRSEAMLQAPYTNNDDALEMRAAFANRPWTELDRRELFRHRQMLTALTGAGYQAVLPAYLVAALTDDPRHGADLRQYVLYGLDALSDSEVHVATARERLSQLTAEQRGVIADVLAYLARTWRMQDAAALLAKWSRAA
ncbi:MAG TPA: DUF6714 family protein [Kofleriaceae bacterium]|nr:DUF6714 family protein [Kofleriaceae bacterium]